MNGSETCNIARVGDCTDSIAAIEREITVLVRHAEAALASKPPAERLVRSGYLLLSVLEASSPLGVAALAGAMQVDISTASRQILPLEREGLVRRLSNQTDGRGSLIEITQLGLHRLHSTRVDRYRRYRELLTDWPEEDRAAFARYLGRLNCALSARPPAAAVSESRE